MARTHTDAVLAEREAICAFLERKGQTYQASRIRRGEHLKPYAVAPTAAQTRGMEEPRGWEEDGA